MEASLLEVIEQSASGRVIEYDPATNKSRIIARGLSFANGVALAGHISVEDHVFLSSDVGAHQFVRMGRYAMVGGKSKIVQDVLPFFTTDGNPPRVRGLNSVGLRRAGFSAESRRALRSAYQLLFDARRPLAEALGELERAGDEHVRHLALFIRASRRGFTHAERRAHRARPVLEHD